jgi:hypothetical protein
MNNTSKLLADSEKQRSDSTALRDSRFDVFWANGSNSRVVLCSKSIASALITEILSSILNVADLILKFVCSLRILVVRFVDKYISRGLTELLINTSSNDKCEQ